MTSDGVRWWRSLRLPIAAVVALSAVTVALIFGLVADRNTMSAGIDRLRSQAVDQLSAATATYEFANTLWSGAVLVDARTGNTGVPASVLHAAQGNAVATYFDGTSMWAANAISDSSVIVIQVPAASLVQERRDLHRSLLYVGVITLLVAALGGWTVAGSLTGRLRRAARWVDVGATTSASDSDLGRDGDEVGELVARIDRLSATLRDRVRTEQAFTADVAHELRTPLTALVSAAELLPESSPATALVRRQVARVRLLVDELLELARADQVTEPVRLEPLDVGAVLGEIAAQMPDLAPDAVDFDDHQPVLAEPQRLERILVNVLANARRHGAGPVRVRMSEGCVVITDSGDGFPEELLASGPQRLRALGRSAGSGLGLVLAKTYSTQIGAALTLSNSDGARVALQLQRTDSSRVTTDGSRVTSDSSVISAGD